MGFLVPEHDLHSPSAWTTVELLVVLIWVWSFPGGGNPGLGCYKSELHVGSLISDRLLLHRLPVRHQRIPAVCRLRLFSQHGAKGILGDTVEVWASPCTKNFHSSSRSPET